MENGKLVSDNGFSVHEERQMAGLLPVAVLHAIGE